MGPENTTDTIDTEQPSASDSQQPAPSPAQNQQQDPPNTPAQPDTGSLPIASAQQQQAATAVQPNPAVVRPVRRSGLGGIVDEIRDALAGGDTTSRLYTDEQGNKFVRHETLTGKQKWARIADSAVHGAAAGLAAGRGGNWGGAVAAGVGAGDKIVADRKNQEQEQNQEVRQAQMDKFNSIKLKHDASAQEFALTRLKVNASENDVKFAQEQIDRERTLGSADMGVFANATDLAQVKKQHPEFWKDVYDNNVVAVPELKPDGTRLGVHLFLRTKGVGDQLVDPGTKVMDYVPSDKPDEPPQLVPRTLAGPATQKQVDDWNNAAITRLQKWHTDRATENKNDADEEFKREQIKTEKTKRIKDLAEADAATARAAKDRAEKPGAGGEDSTKTDIAEGLATGRYLMGKDIPLRTSKDQTSAAEFTRTANEVSMKKFGLPYGPEIIRQEAKFAESDKTQAYLNSIDKFVGTPGQPGQLDQVLKMAHDAGVSGNAPWNVVKLWVGEKLGKTAAKNFEQYLSDTQSALGSLIGNPLLGGGESDLKLKTAQSQFGKNVTLDNLEGAVKNAKEILNNSRAQLARNNRYIQQRYGTAYSPAQQAQPQAGDSGKAVSLKDAMALPQNQGKSEADVRADILAHGHQVKP